MLFPLKEPFSFHLISQTIPTGTSFHKLFPLELMLSQTISSVTYSFRNHSNWHFQLHPLLLAVSCTISSCTYGVMNYCQWYLSFHKPFPQYFRCNEPFPLVLVLSNHPHWYLWFQKTFPLVLLTMMIVV